MLNIKNKGLFVTAIVLIAILVITALALLVGNRYEAQEPQGLPFLSGTGKQTDPYLIYSAQDFVTLASVTNQYNDFKYLHFMQMADLDFASVSNFVPIDSFAGTYNGNGYVIKNLSYTAPEGENAGLFLNLKGSVVHLGVENCIFDGAEAGGIVGSCEEESSLIINCYSNATVIGDVAGGLAPSFPGTVVNSFFYGTLEGYVCGGITGGALHAAFRCTASTLSQDSTSPAFADQNTIDIIDETLLHELKSQFHSSVNEVVSPIESAFETLFGGNCEGTEKDPYPIRSVADLCLFRTLVNAGFSFDSKYLQLEADLDLSSVENWIPIGPSDSETYFWGTLNGNGHVIRNLTVNFPGEDVGFFGTLAGEVMNLGLESGSITGHCIGSFTSRDANANTAIINCYSKLDLYTTGRAGGIADNSGSTLIANCYFGGTIHGGAAYGIAGYTAEEIINCHSARYPLVSDSDYMGKQYRSSGFLEDATSAATHANFGMYAGASRASYLHRKLYRFDKNDTFDGIFHPQLLWILHILSVAILILFIFVLLLVLWRISKNKKPFSLQEMASTVKQLLFEVRQRIRSLTATRSGRVRFTICTIFSVSMALVLLALICGDTWILYSLVCSSGEDVYMDFFNTVWHISGKKYDMGTNHYADPGATYPPLANLCFWLCGLLLPYETRTALSPTVRASSYGAMLYLWLIVAALLIFFVLFAIQGVKGQGKYLLPALALFSPTFLYSYERGNIITIALLFSLIFVLGYKSENAFIRHLAFISLAIATSIKIYPVLFGLLLLRQKNAKHILQCVSYGVIFFILPFAFCGGACGLWYYIKNVTSAFGNYSATHGILMLNYGNITMWLSDIFLEDVTFGQTVSAYTTYPLMALLVLCFFLTKSHWKQLTALTLVQVLYPGFSHFYAGAFYFIPFFAFVRDEHRDKRNYVYAILFCILLAPYQFLCGAVGLDRSTPVYIISVMQLVLAAILFVDCLREFTQRKKSASAPESANLDAASA